MNGWHRKVRIPASLDIVIYIYIFIWLIWYAYTHIYIYIYICSVYMHRHTYIYIYVLRIYLDLLHHKLNKIVSTYRSYILYIKYDCIYHILLCIRYCFMYYTIYKKKLWIIYHTLYIANQISYHICSTMPERPFINKAPSDTSSRARSPAYHARSGTSPEGSVQPMANPKQKNIFLKFTI